MKRRVIALFTVINIALAGVPYCRMINAAEPVQTDNVQQIADISSCGNYVGTNEGAQDYKRWASTVKSFIHQ